MLVETDGPRPLPFDVVESKLQIPVPRGGAVWRTALVNRLRAARVSPVIAVVAPAGYGKTTLLAQWADRDDRPFVWVSLNERDNDPVVLLRHLAAALDRVSPLEQSVLDALRFPGESVWTTVAPRVLRALASLANPIVVILDDAHVLDEGDAAEVTATLAEHLPAGSTLALAARVQPQLPIAALRAKGRLLEIGRNELALTHREAELLLRNVGLRIGSERVEELVARTEGWAAALYLGALSVLGEDTVRDVKNRTLEIAGDDRYIADYFRSEYLSRLSPAQLTFLRRTSVLGRMCGPLCDAVLGRRGSAALLEDLESSNLFLVPLDGRREWFRYHHLFRELLRHEFDEHDVEPDLVPSLNRRAADWFAERGDLESALDYADASGDTDRTAAIIQAIALPVYYSGRIATVDRWLEGFDDEGVLERYPAVAVHGARVHALQGRPEQAERWLAAAERCTETHPDVESRIAVLRAGMCRNGVDEMLQDARRALAGLPADSQWRPAALLAEAAAHVLLGENEQADALLAEAAGASEHTGATETRMVALSERAMIAEARGDDATADALALQARELVEATGLSGYGTGAIERAVSARALLRQGRWDEARACLVHAHRLAQSLTYVLPWLALQARLELARAYVSLRDVAGARGALAEIAEILQRRPDLGVLAEQAADVARSVDAMPEAPSGRASGLTGAELRLLPLLATHLSFREIGERLYVSRNTIKTQAISIYRKLGVSTRSDAIDGAVELGLIEASAPQRAGFTLTG